MSYSLRDDLTYCQVDGRLVFLDVESDRYFQLSRALEHVFTAHVGGDETTDVSDLIALNVLTEHPGAPNAMQPCAMTPAARSIMESSLHPLEARAIAILEVLALVYATKLQLKTHRLKPILLGLQATRNSRTSDTILQRGDLDEERYRQAAAAFSSARRYVPAQTHCLLDSISLLRFLARRALRATLVFGVIPDPFSAHCWLQAGELVLNDTVGNVNAHSPIRIV
ncbi:lasso peptide biosynthesis B2 protein [Rhodanobacter glycinis]|uniref:Lasso peptide biosynthesis B2 protein n=1 Tax=Rhodanobacter glycinis TaxID=582702 RepID=A0A502BS04_9GAMM|nr:lasso peptide biosynthesis B2 protein [Rhodanobacter glycinis]TPG03995.1 lasso peptide biosynthesis B2 protein [Rhodanobacter glycinis]